jgi:microcystin-dependent protein
VTLTTVEIPSHSHSLNATTAIGTTTKIGNNVLPGTVSGGGFLYETVSTGAPLQMASNACSISGSAIPHDNMMPTLGISFVIALYGVFPQRS